MFKRTKGYLLLTMLVLTGLAGRLHSDTLSGKERRILIKELKTSRAQLAGAIEGLSNKQFNFKSSKSGASIKECIYQLAFIENELWIKADLSLKQEASVEKPDVRDDDLPSLITDEKLAGNKTKFKTIREALKLYKNNRNEMQKFVNTSTENIRAHIIQTSFGNLDVYQIVLLNTLLTQRYIREIQTVRSNPNFPK